MDPFYLKLLLSFIVGGVTITLATIVAEKFGSKIGGLLAGIPSTVVVALAFIAWTQSAEQVFYTVTVIPFAISINCVYISVYASLALRTGWIRAIAVGMLVWFIGQNMVVALQSHNVILNIVLGIVIVAICYYVLEYILKVRSYERVALRYTPWQIAGRAIFSGAMISFAVLMSRVAGPAWGGIFSSFPAVITSTLVITSTSVSVDFSRAVLKPLMISGVVNPAVYALVFGHAILSSSIFGAMAIAYVISMISVSLTYVFVRNYVR